MRLKAARGLRPKRLRRARGCRPRRLPRAWRAAIRPSRLSTEYSSRWHGRGCSGISAGNLAASGAAPKESHISNKIFVGNLSFTTTQEQLATMLSEAGRVVRVHIGTDRETGRPRGFAFVEFGSEAEAAAAVRRFDGHELDGRRLRVNDADARPAARPAAPPRSAPAPAFVPGPDAFRAEEPFTPEAGLGRGFKSKGSRRGLRARKRSLAY